MLVGWEYGLGKHGQLDPATGRLETDCQFLVDWVMGRLGLIARLGPLVPYEVPYMVAHTTFRRAPATTPPLPGWIIVYVNPKLLGAVGYYAHTGVVTEHGMYVSAYNTARGVIESPIAATPLTVAFYLDTELQQDGGSMQPVTFDPTARIGVLTLTAEHWAFRLDNGQLAGPYPAGQMFTVYASVMANGADSWLIEPIGSAVPFAIGKTAGTFTPASPAALPGQVVADAINACTAAVAALRNVPIG